MRALAPRSRSRSRFGSSACWHALVVFLLLIGVVAPLAPLQSVTAAPPGQRERDRAPAFPVPTQVVVVGSFQTALGCPADYDPTCGPTTLTDTGGIWAATLPVPPGDYSFRVVATSDLARSLGRGGDPDGGDISLNVPADAAGAYFAYDDGTGEIVAEPVGQRATLFTDLGQQVALRPAPGGGYAATFDAPAGAYGFQVLFADQVVGQDAIALDAPSRVSVAVDDAGNVVELGTLVGTSLTITKGDGAGSALAGACFAVLDASAVVGRACDVDDGAADGQTTLRVPNGLAPGGYRLVETLSPDGQGPASDQAVELGPGSFVIEALAAGGEGSDDEPSGPVGETPTDDTADGVGPDDGTQGEAETAEAPGRVVVRSADEEGEPLAGSCFILIELGYELCDDDGDGATLFEGVPAGVFTLAETITPDGYVPAAESEVEIGDDGARLRIAHEAADNESGETPALPTEPDEDTDADASDGAPGSLTVFVIDRGEAPITGSCFALVPRDGDLPGSGAERCDGDDGAEDGGVTFADIAPGRFRLESTFIPDGFRAPDAETVDLAEGESSDLRLILRSGGQELDGDPGDGEATAEATQAPAPQVGPGRLVILVEDEDGQPVGETCFAIEGDNVSLPDVCDRGDDGRLNIPDLPSGEYRVRQLRTAEGLAVAEQLETVEIRPGEDTEFPVVNLPAGSAVESSEAPTAEPAADGTGAVRILATDPAGNSAPLGCYVLVGPDQYEVCDGDRDDAEGDDGAVLRRGVVPGDYQIFESRVPPGAAPTVDAPIITVSAGETSEVTFGADETALDTAAEQQPAITSSGTGDMLVSISDPGGNIIEGACIVADDARGGRPVCHGEQTDRDEQPGRIRLGNLEPGDYAISVDPPAGYETVPAQSVAVTAGETVRVRFTLDQTVETGSVLVSLTAAGQAVAGACVELIGEESIGPVCDSAAQGWRLAAAQDGAEQAQDGDPAAGRILLEGVPGGDYELRLSDLPLEVVAPEPRRVTVAGGETAMVEVDLVPALGTLVILVGDESGSLVGGSCFALEGPLNFDEICDRGDDGRLNIPEIPAGEYVVRQTSSDAALEPASEERIQVPAGGSAELRVVNTVVATPTPLATEPPPSPTAAAEPTESAQPTPEATVAPATEVGTLLLVERDQDGEPQGGACFRVTDGAGTVVNEVCDNGPSDPDSQPGVVVIADLPVGSYGVEQTRAPDGFAIAEGQVVIVEGGIETTAEFIGDVLAIETASVVLAAQAEDGSLIEGQCFRLLAGGEEIGSFCDGGDEDLDPEPGSLELADLAVGTYEAEPVTGDEEAADANPADRLVGAQRAVEQRSFTVRRGERPIVRLALRRQREETGDLVVAKRDERNRPLGGACFALFNGSGDTVSEVCDDGAADGDGNVGQIRFDAVPNGDYTLVESRAPDGYLASVDEPVTVNGGRVRRVTVVNEPTVETASLTVVALDEKGTALPGACFSLLRGAGLVGPICDEDDSEGADGRTFFADQEDGAVVVRETRVPAGGYDAANDQALLLAAGEARVVEVVHASRSGSVQIEKLDEAGQPLGGACFALLGGDGAVIYELCDNDASDGATDDGMLLLQGVAAGAYLVQETRAPAGYGSSADQEATVEGNRETDLRFENVPLPPPPQRGDLVIYKVDAEDRFLPGACFSLLQDEVTIAGPRCDANDGADDGTVLFADVGVGDYLLREVRRPSADYLPAEDAPVSIVLNQTTEVAVVNEPRPGRVVVRKTDVDGDRLSGACFNLEGDGQDPACTNADGVLAFENLTPGGYRLVETEAPPGYLAAAPIEDIVVRPGATTTLDVIDELAPPPPDTGSIQFLKFYCPAREGGEGTEIVDSSDGGPSRLARTAGCERGDASFRFIAASGEGGPGDVATGADGRYQATVLAGDYELTELAPDLPGDASEEVTVFINQMTTVVVLNYVTPPAPSPAAIDVLKYTCDPGFEGTVFADFAQGCLTEGNLTNSVLFRLSGEVSGRRLTGDGGSQGVTGFYQLPPGNYRLREEPPIAAQSVFAFCGIDPNNPDLRSTTTGIDLTLGAGANVTCYWFNVPDDLTETTGAIIVHKYGCALPAAESAPNAFDWYDECVPGGAGIPFSLALLDREARTELGTEVSDGNGLVRFNRLDPGVYELQEVGGTWCRAESDSVDASGNVIVRTGQRANVWIFNCLGTSRPPNTGAGPLASAPPEGRRINSGIR